MSFPRPVMAPNRARIPCFLAYLLLLWVACSEVAKAQDLTPEDDQKVCKPGEECVGAQPRRSSASEPADARDIVVDDTRRMPNRPADEIRALPAGKSAPPEGMLESQKRKPSELTEFQQFVRDSTGKILPIYGYSLFDDVPTTFAPVDRIAVPSDYIIGPGDEILIRAWGQINVSARLVVDRMGNIYLPKVGNIAVAGLKYQQLGDYLKSAIGRVFQNFDLTVSLGELRSIQVFVVGHAARPGTYTVSSLSTLVNAIFSSGGPSLRGSMRKIQLRRSGHTATEFDLYDLLLKGDKTKDVPLLPGDVIYFAPVGPLMALTGSVNAPGIYELRAETTLGGALELAGGLATTASGAKVMMERIYQRSIRQVEELSLDIPGLNSAVKDGDLVRVLPLSPRFDNSVTLRGNVAQPGRYPWRANMKIRDLIPSRDFLIKREYWTSRNRVESSKKDEMVESHAPEVNWDYALIERLDAQSLNTRLIPFNLRIAIESTSPDDPNNVSLEPGDVVTVYSQTDLKTPLAVQNKFIRLEGEFQAAGIYQVRHGGLREAIRAAGGLTSDAYLLGAQFYRESTRIEQQKRLDAFLSQMEADVERNLSAAARNVTSPEEAAALKEKGDSQRRLIEKMRQTRASGRIVFTIDPNRMDLEALPDLPLEDGDHFIVPPQPATLNVIGAVYNESSQLYKSGWKARSYLRGAGGMTREADRNKTFVIRANGSVVSPDGNGWWSGGIDSVELMPGDTIVVPQNLSRIGFLRGLRDWTQVISQLALGAAAVRILQ
jgi:polysaccharide biosynthesis/export protein